MFLKRRQIISVSIVAAVMFLLFTTILAQNNETIITIAVQEWQRDVYNPALFADFEAENPGVKVVVKTLRQNAGFYNLTIQGIEEFMEEGGTYAASADILPVSTYQISPETTRAGFFLDMSPLLVGDATLDTDDFFEPVLQSYQWDGGTWALPIAARVRMLIYDRNAFDEVNLAYPDESWGISDFLAAGRALTTYKDNGDVERAALLGFDNRLLFRALLGKGVYDDSVIPEVPALVNSDLAAILETWKAYQLEVFGESGPDFSTVDFNTMPLNISGVWQLDNNGFGSNSDADYAASLLPGGVAGLEVEGFAISAGTEQPMLAYELIKYLTTNAEVVARTFADSPARRSMVGVESDGDDVFFGPERSEETQALINRALENALPASELRYFDAAISLIFPNRDPANPRPDDMMQALQEQQDKLLDDFETLAQMDNTNVVVSTPVPTPVLTANEKVLKFHIYDVISPIPNLEEWESLIMDFTADDPEVGFVELSTGFSQQPDDADALDCYYRSSNIVPSMDLTTILPLDPFLAADINFDESEIVSGVMQQVRREGQTWAVPLSVQPMVLWYDSNAFDEAGAFLPYSGWTTVDFEDALQQIQLTDGEAPFAPQQGGNTHIMLLAAAYGADPIDYTVNPPIYNLTDPTVIEAFRDVLNLAKDGYMEYQKLGVFGGGSGFGPNASSIYESFLSSLDWRFNNRGNTPDDVEDTYKLVSFPRGLEFTPASFDIGTGYINANTLNPEACYRLLTHVSESTALFNAMPVRPDMIDSVADSDDVKAVYEEMAAVLSQPDVLNIPTPFSSRGSFGAFIMQVWMNRAFDAYVLDDADLETALIDAQGYIEDYTQCINSIEEIPDNELRNMNPDELSDYFNQFNECAIQVDPTMAEELRPFKGEDDE